MRRDELAHILRAAGTITGTDRVYVLGSQSILGAFDEDELPPATTLSSEADLAFDEPERGEPLWNQVDGAIGEGSAFHATNGYYAQGVEISTAMLPTGWTERVVHFAPQSANGVTGVCLEPHDLVAAKLAAGRPKDYEFVSALLDVGLVDAAVLADRVAQTPCPQVAKDRALALIASTQNAGDVATTATCSVCGRPIRSEESIARGCGPSCAERR